MKYGPNGENTDWQDQCWTQKTDEDYVKCIYSERDPRKHSNSYMSAKKYNMEYSNSIVDILKARGVVIRHAIMKQDAWCQVLVVAFSVLAILLFGSYALEFRFADLLCF